MADSIPTSASQPLGHHHPLGTHSLGVLNLAYFFPAGLPDLDSIDEVTPSSPEASSLHRTSSLENPVSPSSTIPQPFFSQNVPSPEITLAQHHSSTVESSPIQRQSSAKDNFSESRPSPSSSNSGDSYLQPYALPENNAPESLLPKIVLGPEISPIQNIAESAIPTTDHIQSQILPNPKVPSSQNYISSSSIVLGDETIQSISIPEENAIHKSILSENDTSENLWPKALEPFGQSIRPKLSSSDSITSEYSWPNATYTSSSSNLDNRTSPKAILPDSFLSSSVSGTETYNTQNYALPQETELSANQFKINSETKEASIAKKVTTESAPITPDSILLNSDIPDSSMPGSITPNSGIPDLSVFGSIASNSTDEVFSAQRLTFSENTEQQNSFLEVMPSNSGTSDHVQAKSSTGQEHQSTSYPSVGESSRASTDEQSRISSDLSTESSTPSDPILQTKNSSQSRSLNGQFSAEISPTPGTQTHPPLSHDLLPVIVDFSTPPTPLQPQRIADHSPIPSTNSSYIAKSRSDLPIDSSASQTSPKFESLSSKNSQSVSEINVISSTETTADNIEDSLTSVSSSATDSSPSDPIQRISEHHSITPIASASDLQTKLLNNEVLAKAERLTSEVGQDTTERSDLPPVESQSSFTGESASSDSLSNADQIDSENIQRDHEDHSNFTTDHPPSFTADLLDPKTHFSGAAQPLSQETDYHSESNANFSVDEISLPAASGLKPISSGNVESPSSSPVQRAGEGDHPFPVVPTSTSLPQSFKGEVSQDTRKSLLDQSQEEGMAEFTLPTDIASISTETALDIEISPTVQETPFEQIQKDSEKHSTSLIAIDSIPMAKDLQTELSNNVQTSSSSQMQRNSEENLASPIAPSPESTKVVSSTTRKTNIEESLSQQNQATSEEESIFLSRSSTASQMGGTASNAVTSFEASSLEKNHEARALSRPLSRDVISRSDISELNNQTIEAINDPSPEISSSPEISQSTDGENPIVPSNIAPISEIKFLESNALTTAKNAPSHPIHKVDEGSSTSSRNITSETTADSFSPEIQPSIDTLVSDQNQQASEEKDPYSVDIDSAVKAADLTAKDFARYEESSAIQRQKSHEEISISSIDTVSLSETTPLVSESLSRIQASISDQVQKFTESNSIASTDINTSYHPDHSTDNTSTIIEQPAANKIQKASKVTSTFSANITSLPTAINLESTPTITTNEDAAFEQDQHIDKEHHPLTHVGFEPELDSPNKPLIDSENLTSSQIQKAAEDSVIFRESNASIPSAALEPSSLGPSNDRLAPQVEPVGEENTGSAAETSSEIKPTMLGFQDQPSLGRVSCDQTPNSFGQSASVSKDIPSTSTTENLNLDPHPDVQGISTQQIQKYNEGKDNSSISTSSISSTSDSSPENLSDIQPALLNVLQQASEENQAFSLDNSFLPSAISSEALSGDSRQNISSQIDRDAKDTSLQFTTLMSDDVLQEAPLGHQSILDSKLFLSRKTQETSKEKPTILADSSSKSPAPNLASEDLGTDSLARIEDSSWKQSQEVRKVSPSISQNIASTASLAILQSKSLLSVDKALPSIEEKLSIQAATNKYSVFPSDSISLYATTAFNRNFPPEDENFSLHSAQPQSDSSLSAVPNQSSQPLTSFLMPEMLPALKNTSSNTVQRFYETKSNRPVESIPLPQETSLNLEPWHESLDIASASFQGNRQPHRHSTESLLPNVIPKSMADKTTAPETVSSVSSYPTSLQSGFGMVQSHNAQGPDFQDSTEVDVITRPQAIRENSLEFSRTEALLPSQVQSINGIHSVYSANVITSPVVDSPASEKPTQFNDLSFQNIQKTHDSNFNNSIRLSSTYSVLLENRASGFSHQEHNQERLSTEENSSYGNAYYTNLSGTSLGSVTDELDAGDLGYPSTSYPSDIQRFSDHNPTFPSNLDSTNSDFDRTPRNLLKPETLLLDSSLKQDISAITSISPVNLDLDRNTAQSQRSVKKLDHNTISNNTIKSTQTWPENLSASRGLDSIQAPESHKELPVLIDFNSSPQSLQRTPESKQREVNSDFEVDVAIRQDSGANLSSNGELRSDQNQNASKNAHAVYQQSDLDLSKIQLSSAYNTEGEPFFNSSSTISNAESSPESSLEKSKNIIDSESFNLPRETNVRHTIAEPSFNSHSNLQDGLLNLQTSGSQASLDAAIAPQLPQATASNRSPLTTARSTPTIQPQAVLPTAHPPEIDQDMPISAMESELAEQSWSRNQSEFSSPTTSPSDLDNPLIQRLVDNHGSELPPEWQSLADLVASQGQAKSTPIESIIMARPESISQAGLSKESMEKSLDSSMTPLAELSTPPTIPIQRKLSVSRSKPVLKFRNQPSIQSHNASNIDLSTPSFLVQAKEDTPFTTIEANQSRNSDNKDPKSWALEQLAQEIYYRMRQRLTIEKERHGRLYDKRFR